MDAALKLDRKNTEHFPKSNLSLLDKNELKSINGGVEPASALAGWKTIAFLAGGTLGAVAVAVGATILIYKGVEYLITD